MPKPEFHDQAVAAVFNAYPKPIKTKLLILRQMIFDVARETSGVGELQEALRWGQPSYLTPETGSGSTIRLDRIKNDPTKCAMYFHCQSGLVEAFKELYGNELRFGGNRSIVLGLDDGLAMNALRHCVSLALTHHLRTRTKTKARK
jgi:hypothetical protein